MLPTPRDPRFSKAYAFRAPLSTHWRKASCVEVDCQHYREGWQSQIDETSELGQRQADYIRRHSGRRFREELVAPTLTVFVFEAGQRCFDSDNHRKRLDREETFLVRNGTRGTQQLSSQQWVEDFGEHQQRLADQQQRG